MKKKKRNNMNQGVVDRKNPGNDSHKLRIRVVDHEGTRNARHINDINAQIQDLMQQKIRIMSTGSTMEFLPNEILLNILKSMPDLGALQSMIVTCKHLYRVFQSRREEVMFTVLQNDVGRDVLIDYMHEDFLMSTPYFSYHQADIHYGEISEERLLATIAHRKTLSLPHSFNGFSEAKVVYIAKHAHLVRRVVEQLVRDVLFGPAYEDVKFKSAKVVYHEFLAHLPASMKSRSGFNLADLKKDPDPDELYRFKRGMHRLHICRLLCTGGLRARSRVYGTTPSRWNPGTRDFRVLVEWSENSTRPVTMRAAAIATHDSCFGFDRSSRCLTAFVLSLPPWEREELAACAKLVARGYAQAARIAQISPVEFPIVRMHDAVLFHLKTLLLVSKSPETFKHRTHLHPTTENHTLNSYYGQHGRALWRMLFERHAYLTGGCTLAEHLLRRNINGPQNWVTRGATEGPHAARFASEAPPLYRIMMELVVRPYCPVRIKPQQWVEDCWVMWSNPARLRAWPRWQRLAEAMEYVDAATYGSAKEN